MYQRLIKNIIYPLSDKLMGLSINKNLKKIEAHSGIQLQN